MTQSLQVRVQKFGVVLSAMVMPNIGVFIGWGLLAALFIDTGWIPNKFLGVLVSPILTYLLPFLLGYTAGSNFYGRCGGVIGAFATIGVVIGSDITMLIGGIAEVCFPYCLTQPLTILGPIAGNFFSLTVLSHFDGGAIGPPSPGSVYAFYLMTPKSALLVNSIAYFGDLAISFLVTSIILKLTVKRDADDEEDVPVDTTDGTPVAITPTGNVRLAKAQLHPNVDHVAGAEIPADADLVVTNVNLAARAKKDGTRKAHLDAQQIHGSEGI